MGMRRRLMGLARSRCARNFNSILAAGLAALLMTLAAPLFAQDESTPTPVPSPTADQIAAGKADFMKHCAPCHSASGKGNGPEVNVIPGIKPADLTKITMKNGGLSLSGGRGHHRRTQEDPLP
jgi:mono/diheme cytochrome c family protein